MTADPKLCRVPLSSQASCVLCGKTVDKADHYCFGCKAVICDQHHGDPWGSHQPRAHEEIGDDD